MTDLDAKVAEAIGIDFHLNEESGCWLKGAVLRHEVVVLGSGSTSAKISEFSPSTDLNAAFEAAEKVGLFDVYQDVAGQGCQQCLLLKQFGNWWVKRVGEYAGSGMGITDHRTIWIVDAPTPAEAICLAILKLKESK